MPSRPNSRLSHLAEMGIDVYARRSQSSQPAASTEPPQPQSQPQPQPAKPATSVQEPRPEQKREAAPAGDATTTDTANADTNADTDAWRRLESRVSGCADCPLHKTRTQTVFGVGDRAADWLFVGEGPGAEEDKQGEPFVGRAGKLLDKMLAALGFDRAQVYIANTVKCRPPENRMPRPEELAACNGYLQQQIALIRPRIIVALGGVAAHTLLENDTPVGKLRGHVYHWGETGIPLVVTYHPAYLLRSPLQKKAAWEDLQLAQRVVAGEET